MMKLKKVAALCSKSLAFILFDQIREDGEIRQWLGDGIAAYPLSGLPLLDKENLCAMFDISEKKRKKCLFQREKIPDSLNFDDYEDGELALSDNLPTVEYDGYVVKPLGTRKGVIFIQNAYLSPLEDMADYLRLYERRGADGKPYIAAKNGMEIVAVIMPVDIVKPGFVEKLDELARMCRKALRQEGGGEERHENGI